MTTEPLSFLSEGDGEAVSQSSQAPAADAAATGEGAVGPARDASGRFVGKPDPASGSGEAAPAAAGEASAHEPAKPAQAPAQAEGATAPISALLDERDKRKAAEERARALEERLAASRPAQPPMAPQDQIRLERYADNLRYSRRFAEKEHGKELIEKVHEWAVAKADSDPAWNAQMMRSDDPYEAAVADYQREQLLGQVTPSRFAEFQAWEKAQAEARAAAGGDSGAQQQQPAAAAPPRSIADAPGTGGAGKPHVNVGPGEAFKSAIPG